MVTITLANANYPLMMVVLALLWLFLTFVNKFFEGCSMGEALVFALLDLIIGVAIGAFILWVIISLYAWWRVVYGL